MSEDKPDYTPKSLKECLVDIEISLMNARTDLILTCAREEIPYKTIEQYEQRIEFAILGVQELQKSEELYAKAASE